MVVCRVDGGGAGGQFHARTEERNLVLVGTKMATWTWIEVNFLSPSLSHFAQ